MQKHLTRCARFVGLAALVGFMCLFLALSMIGEAVLDVRRHRRTNRPGEEWL